MTQNYETIKMPQTFTLPKYTSPTDLDYGPYSATVKQFNRSLLRKVKSAIDSHPPQIRQDYAFGATGSDGRLEKGPQSKVELIFLHRNGLPSGVVEETLEHLHSRMPGMIFTVAEIKPIDNPELPISRYAVNPTQIYPTRAADAIFIYGDEQVLTDAKLKLEEELKTPFGKKVHENMSAERRRARSITQSGSSMFKGEPVKHFDLEEGVACYDESNGNGAIRGSFKYGPLRLVQYRFAQDAIIRVRGNEKTPLSLLYIPSNIADRLYYVQAEKIGSLSLGETEALADHYLYFLWLYHLTQENFMHHNQTDTAFDRKEVKQRLEEMLKITEKPLL